MVTNSIDTVVDSSVDSLQCSLYILLYNKYVLQTYYDSVKVQCTMSRTHATNLPNYSSNTFRGYTS